MFGYDSILVIESKMALQAHQAAGLVIPVYHVHGSAANRAY